MKRENNEEIQTTNLSSIAGEKCRASTLIPLNTDKEVQTKPRSCSMADSLTRANSMLQKMSIDNENTEDIYEELQDALEEDVYTDDELDKHPVHTSHELETYELPPPRDGKTYAFHEIKSLIQLSDKQLNVDLKELALSSNITFDETDEFPAVMMLKKYLAVTT